VVEYSPVTGDPGDNWDSIVLRNLVNYKQYIMEAAEQVDVL
jgi:hypothetical protein